MSLHEYIDIPLEGSLFTVRLPSLPPAASSRSRSCTLSSRHSPPLATRLFKEWLEASVGARMNAREDRVPGERGREGKSGGGWRFVPPSAPMGSTRVFDPGMQDCQFRVEFRIASADIGAD